MQRSDGKGRRILVVDDERDVVELVSECLATEGHSVTHATDGDTALQRVRAWKPHLILLDVNLPGGSGLDLIQKLRAATSEDYVAIMVLSANMTSGHVSEGLNAGADDYMTKPFRAQDLLARVRVMLRIRDLQDSLRRANHRNEELASTDELTGLLNMRAAFRRGEEEIQRCRRFRKPVSALLVNVDRFASVNEGATFLFGNQVLEAVGAKIKECVRHMDIVARVGADEFFVLLVETDLAGAEFVSERMREAIQALDIRAEKHAAKVTASIGVAGFGAAAGEGGMCDLLHHAQEALRSAKAGGANKIEIYSFA